MILCQGGGGVGVGCLTQFQLFQTKITTTQKGDFVGILLQCGGGSPVPTKKSPKITSEITKNHIKITNHKKMGLFHEKII